MKFPEIVYKIAGPILEREIRANIGWLFSGRVFRMGVGFFISILVVRYLGPSRLGILSYALSLKTFFGAFVYLGLSGLVIRELVRTPEDQSLILGTAFYLKLAGGLIGFCALLLFSYVSSLSVSGWTETLVIWIVALSLFPGAFECIDFWFQSKVQAKFVVLSKNIAFTVTSLLKVLLVLTNKGLLFFAVVSSLEFFIAAGIISYYYISNGSSFKTWTFQVSKACEFLKQSWIIILSGFFALVYLKIDQIMLRFMVGIEEVGFYSVAASLSEVWYFIPTSVAASVFPKLINLHKVNTVLYEKSLQQIFDVFFFFSVFVAILCQLFAGWIIPFLYGEIYNSTVAILQIHIWAGVFMFQRALLSRWFFIEDALKYSLYGASLGACINVLLNWILIPFMKGKGAAIATLIGYATTSYLFLFFFAKTRPVAKMMTKSFLIPLRIIWKKKNDADVTGSNGSSM